MIFRLQEITNVVEKLCVEACSQLPQQMANALKQAEKDEPSPVGRDILAQLVKNADIAANEDVPICQDTGLAVVLQILARMCTLLVVISRKL